MPQTSLAGGNKISRKDLPLETIQRKTESMKSCVIKSLGICVECWPLSSDSEINVILLNIIIKCKRKIEIYKFKCH